MIDKRISDAIDHLDGVEYTLVGKIIDGVESLNLELRVGNSERFTIYKDKDSYFVKDGEMKPVKKYTEIEFVIGELVHWHEQNIKDNIT